MTNTHLTTGWENLNGAGSNANPLHSLINLKSFLLVNTLVQVLGAEVSRSYRKQQLNIELQLLLITLFAIIPKCPWMSWYTSPKSCYLGHTAVAQEGLWNLVRSLRSSTALRIQIVGSLQQFQSILWWYRKLWDRLCGPALSKYPWKASAGMKTKL